MCASISDGQDLIKQKDALEDSPRGAARDVGRWAALNDDLPGNPNLFSFRNSIDPRWPSLCTKTTKSGSFSTSSPSHLLIFSPPHLLLSSYVYRISIFTAIISKSMTDSHTRSFVKGVTWRALGTMDTIMLSFIVTGNIGDALKIGFTEVVTKIILFYLHERLWNIIPMGRIHGVGPTHARSLT